MLNIIKQMLTERDGTTTCPVRVSTGLVAMLYHLAAVIGCWTNQIHLDIGSLGQYLQQMTILIAASGAAVGVKSALKGDAQ